MRGKDEPEVEPMVVVDAVEVELDMIGGTRSTRSLASAEGLEAGGDSLGAYNQYKASLENMIPQMKTEADPARREELRLTIKDYFPRAESLKRKSQGQLVGSSETDLVKKGGASVEDVFGFSKGSLKELKGSSMDAPGGDTWHTRDCRRRVAAGALLLVFVVGVVLLVVFAEEINEAGAGLQAGAPPCTAPCTDDVSPDEKTSSTADGGATAAAHPCDDGSHRCYTGVGGLCLRNATGTLSYGCACTTGYSCSLGCESAGSFANHTCAPATSAPSSAPGPGVQGSTGNTEVLGMPLYLAILVAVAVFSVLFALLACCACRDQRTAKAGHSFR